MKKSKTVMKRLFVLLISIVMVMGMMTTTAFAADGSATITITKPSTISTSLSGMQVKAYKVLDQENPNETDASLKQYAVTQNFRSFFNIEAVKTAFGQGSNVYLTYDNSDNAHHLIASNSQSEGAITFTNHDALDSKYPEADLVSRMQTEGSEIATFYTWLEKYIEATQPAEETSTPTNSGSSIVFSDLDEGYYALTFSSVPAGISVKQGILVPTSSEIELKAEPITVEKTVSANNGTSFSDKVSAAMDTVLEYKIKTKVPTVKDYSNLTEFKLSDTYTNQKLVQTQSNNFVLKVGTKTYNLNSSGTAFVNGSETIATLDTTTTPNTFKVDFATNILANYQGEDVVLTYYAQLTAAAVNINGNDVTLNYTNNGSPSVQTDSTEVYTYGIEVQKNFSSSDKPYSGVTFKLYKDNNGSKGDQIALVGSDGDYNVPANGETGSADDLSLSTDGKLIITGLDKGTYWLEETNAPDGYTKSDNIKIELKQSTANPAELDSTSAAYLGGDKAISTSIGAQDQTNISIAQFTVLNQKGFSLPQTGGAGTWMLTIGGIVLIAAAAGVFVTFRRKTTK